MAVAALAALGFLVVFVTLTPLVNWWARKLSGPWFDAKGDTLIVLGGSMLDSGVIGQTSYGRSVYAARAYQSGGFRHIVVSGGAVDNPVSVAMAHFLVCSGAPADIIRTEQESRSTRENAQRLPHVPRVARFRQSGFAGSSIAVSGRHQSRAALAGPVAGLSRVVRRDREDRVLLRAGMDLNRPRNTWGLL
jgi:hypothetical protein